MSSRPRAVGSWLLLVAALVLAMVVVGGLTRLSRSGLSIVEWKPLTGALPPMGDAAWAAEYAKYQASPEGRTVNAGMPMEAFQQIFYVEWAHRLLGRITGLVVLLPLLFFTFTRRLGGRRALAVLGIFALGALQGLAGWLMVKSGLVDAPHVSPYRLTLHLSLALLCFALLLWVALAELVGRRPRLSNVPSSLTPFAIGSLVLVSLTVVWGGLMAGTHAGLVAPTFPTMNGAWIPDGMHRSGDGLLQSAAGNALTIHFLHRLLAYATTLGLLLTTAAAFTRQAPRLARVAMLLACAHLAVQIVLGALTVLGHVPLVLASLHQTNAALLLGWCVVFLYAVRRA